MNTNILSLANNLSNEELLTRLKSLAQTEQQVTVTMIAHLAVLEERELYLEEGFSSMFAYCREVLHLSEYAAYSRIEAARAVRKYPAILGFLENGSLNVTTLGLLVPELSPENHMDLLTAAKYKSKREVNGLVARLRPRPAVPTSIRKLPAPRGFRSSEPPSNPARQSPSPVASSLDEVSLFEQRHESVTQIASASPVLSSVVQPPAAPAVVEPLAPERYKVQFTASPETCEKLRLAQNLLRHQIPNGDAGQIFDRALTALLKELTRQKYAATDRPRERRRDSQNTRVKTHSRHIPADVRRTVWLRDGAQCAFVGKNGRRCADRAFLEFHHVIPYSAGGGPTADNIQLRCRAHNGFESELYFGRKRSRVGARALDEASTESGPSSAGMLAERKTEPG